MGQIHSSNLVVELAASHEDRIDRVDYCLMVVETLGDRYGLPTNPSRQKQAETCYSLDYSVEEAAHLIATHQVPAVN